MQDRPMRILLLSFFFASCQFTSLVTGNIDYLITLKSSKIIPLYYKQKQSFQKDIQSLLNNSKNEIKKFQIYLTEDYKRIQYSQKLQTNDIEKYQLILFSLRDQYEYILKKHIHTLTPKQYEEYLSNLSGQVEKAKRYSNDKYYVDELTTRLEKILGPLTKDQKSILKQNKNNFSLWFKNKYERLKELEYGLKKEKKPYLNVSNLFMKSKTSLKSELEKKHMKEIFSAYIDIINNLTKKQKEVLKDKLDTVNSFINDYKNTSY